MTPFSLFSLCLAPHPHSSTAPRNRPSSFFPLISIWSHSTPNSSLLPFSLISSSAATEKSALISQHCFPALVFLLLLPTPTLDSVCGSNHIWLLKGFDWGVFVVGFRFLFFVCCHTGKYSGTTPDPVLGESHPAMPGGQYHTGIEPRPLAWKHFFFLGTLRSAQN